MSGSHVGLGIVTARTKSTPPTTASDRARGYADRLTTAEISHGTLDGYAAGCRAELACPARHAPGGLSCLTVGIRYAGDWPFRRAVDAGATPAEAAAAIAAADLAARPAPARAVRPRRRRSDVPRGDRTSPAPSRPQAAAEHGTMRGYVAGCHSGDPCPASPTCAEISAANRRRWRQAPARPIEHGKRQGYARGCRVPEACPNYGTDAPTCGDVGRAYGRAVYARKARAA